MRHLQSSQEPQNWNLSYPKYIQRDYYHRIITIFNFHFYGLTHSENPGYKNGKIKIRRTRQYLNLYWIRISNYFFEIKKARQKLNSKWKQIINYFSDFNFLKNKLKKWIQNEFNLFWNILISNNDLIFILWIQFVFILNSKTCF